MKLKKYTQFINEEFYPNAADAEKLTNKKQKL